MGAKSYGLDQRRFENGDVFVDVGANVGHFAWLFEHLHSLGFHSYVLPETHRFHDYAYPERSRERPRRVGEPLTRVHNVIFSRIDADHL